MPEEKTSSRKKCDWIALVSTKEEPSKLIVNSSRVELSEQLNTPEILKVHNVWKAYPLDAKIRVVL